MIDDKVIRRFIIGKSPSLSKLLFTIKPFIALFGAMHAVKPARRLLPLDYEENSLHEISTSQHKAYWKSPDMLWYHMSRSSIICIMNRRLVG